MNRLKLIIPLLLSLAHSSLFANSINVHVFGGPGWVSFKKTDNIHFNSFVVNSYSTSKHASYPWVGLGVSYQLNQLFSSYPQLSLTIGANAYRIKYRFSGINSPFINSGEFDSLTFHVKDQSYSFLFESRLIYTCYRLEPYLLGGLGIAWNKAYDYSEFPSNPNLSAVALTHPFGNKTRTNFAYEIGAGIQTSIYKFNHSNLNLFVDYRYLNWGKMQLNTSSLQSSTHGPQLGTLATQLLSAGLQYQFC